MRTGDCEAADIVRNWFKKAREALVNRGAPQVDWPHVFYRLSPSETETLLRGILCFGRTLAG